MSDILNYSLSLWQAVVDTLAQPPILYLNGFLIAAVTIKIFLSFVPWYKDGGRRF